MWYTTVTIVVLAVMKSICTHCIDKELQSTTISSIENTIKIIKEINENEELSTLLKESVDDIIDRAASRGVS